MVGRGAGRLAALAAVSAVGLVAAAVLGDGYFEIAKHVWLAAYLLVVTAAAVVLAVVLAVVAWVVRRAAHRRPAPTPSSASRADAAAGSLGGVPGR